MQLYGGVKLAVNGEGLGQNVDAGGLIGGDDELAARVHFELGDGVLHTAAELQNLLGIIGEDAAGGGERDAAAEAFEELGAEFLLELPHLGANRRLRAIAGLRGLGKALQADNFEKCVELVEIHKHPSGTRTKKSQSKL